MKLSTPLLFYCALGVTMGIVLRLQESISLYIFSCLLILFLFLYKKFQWLLLPFLCCLFFYFYTSQFLTIFPFEKDQMLTVEGEVTKINSETMILLSDETYSYYTYIDENTDMPSIASYCTVYGSFSKADAKGNFFMEHYFHREGIAGTIFPEELKCTPQKMTYYNFLPIVKEKIIQSAYKESYQSASAILIALALGETRFLNKDVEDAFRSLGLSHVLAISGSHFTLLTFVFLATFKRTNITTRTIVFFLLVLFPLYALLVGLPAAVMRATIMAACLLLVREFHLRITPQQIFFLTYILVLLYQPLFLVDIGFLYSFIITFLFLTIIPYFYFDFLPSFVKLLQLQILITIVTLPITIALSNQVSILGLLVNPIFTPVFEMLLFPFSLICLIASLCLPFLVPFLYNLLEFSITNISHLFIFLNKLPFTSIPLVESMEMSIVYILLCLITLYFGWEGFSKSLRFLSSFVLVLLVHYSLPYIDSKGELAVLYVEQGDSIVVDFPFREEVWLIDTGGKVNVITEENKNQIYMNYLRPALEKRGIRTINKLILTHDDTDHIGEAKKLLESHRVKEVVIGRCHIHFENTKEVIEEAKKQEVKVTVIDEPMRWKVKHVTVTAFHSSKTCHDDTNNNSLLLHFDDVGGKSVLLSGDLEKEGEKSFMKQYGDMDIDILKVGHHGSNSSSTDEFLEQITPEIAVISAGENNRYGHPHTEVLENLLNVKAKIIRTDVTGDWSFYFQ